MLFYLSGSVTSFSCGFGFKSWLVGVATLCGLRPQIIMSRLLFRQAVRINTLLFTHAACMHSTTFQRMKGCYNGCLRPGLGSTAARDELLKCSCVFIWRNSLRMRFSDNKLMCLNWSSRNRFLVCFTERRKTGTEQTPEKNAKCTGAFCRLGRKTVS